MRERDLVFHALAIKRYATPAALGQLIGLAEERVAAALSVAVATERAVEVKGAYALTPLSRLAVEARYGGHFAAVRENPGFIAAYQRFETINLALKGLITDWQMIDIGGKPVPNDHTDSSYDIAIIDKLGRLHEMMEPIFETLAHHLPRLRLYENHLLKALERAEDGDVAWVSDVHKPSYHTVWFELHEDLLRIMGKVREN